LEIKISYTVVSFSHELVYIDDFSFVTAIHQFCIVIYGTILNYKVIVAHGVKPGNYAFTEIGVTKLRSANIDPNNMNKIFVRLSLRKEHPVKLNLMPRGRWSITEVLTILQNAQSGLGVEPPAIPTALLFSGDSDTASIDAEIRSQIDTLVDRHKWISCDAKTRSDIDLSKQILQDAEMMNLLIQRKYGQAVLTSWSDILQPSSAVIGVDCNNQSTSVSLLLDCSNKHVAFLVGLRIQAFAAIADVEPIALANTQSALGCNLSNVERLNWSQGARASDRRDIRKSNAARKVSASTRTALAAVDADATLKKYKWLARVVSTTLSLSYSKVQFGRDHWTSVSIRGVPWADMSYSSESLLNNSHFQTWKANNLSFRHKSHASTLVQPHRCLYGYLLLKPICCLLLYIH
jgi:hypothetical protein